MNFEDLACQSSSSQRLSQPPTAGAPGCYQPDGHAHFQQGHRVEDAQYAVHEHVHNGHNTRHTEVVPSNYSVWKQASADADTTSFSSFHQAIASADAAIDRMQRLRGYQRHDSERR